MISIRQWIVFIQNEGASFVRMILTLSQTSPGFYLSAAQAFRKHCGKKEKSLITSNFSFSPSVFYPFGELSVIFIRFVIVVCKLFQFGRV